MKSGAAPEFRWRWPLFGLNLAQALVFGGAALMLPWRHYPLFSAMTAVLALGHAATALAAVRRDVRLPRIWRLVSLVALLWLLLLTWSVLTSAIYLARVYGDLGEGIAVALAIGWCIPVLVSVPTACWALASTPPLLPKSSAAKRGKKHGAVIASIVVAAATWQKLASASTTPVDDMAVPTKDLQYELGRQLPSYDQLPKKKGKTPAFTLEHLECKRPVAADVVTIFIQLRVARGDALAVETHCVQHNDRAEAFKEVGRILSTRATRRPIKIDVVRGVQPLTSTDPLLDGFKLRPGLDGICEGGECLLGWQLVAREMVNTNAPVSAVPELRMGFDPRQVRRALGSAHSLSDLAGLTRLETDSFVYDGKLISLSRMHRTRVELSKLALKRANDAVQRHIERALLADGRFRYRLHPFSGAVDEDGFNLPRQAGTTLAFCELGRKNTARKVAGAALRKMASLEVRVGDRSVLVTPPDSKTTDLGSQALPLSALLSCRALVENRYDELIGRLGNTLLRMQREAGDFYPDWDLGLAEPIAGPPPVFAPGQAVLALVLMEKAQLANPDLPFPPRERVTQAVDRAMNYYGKEWWDHPLGKLFYVEENWHCLAARAALAQHRNDAYEQFCIEHTDFKSRFIVGEEASTKDMVGAFALSPMIPPPNTATAGVGEALAASIAVKRARHQDTRVDEARLRRLLKFLLRQQWEPTTSGACRDPHLVNGGFSDSMLTPSLRIDFSQHAWAALRHGGHMLGLSPAPRLL